MTEETYDIVIITILDQELAALKKIFHFSDPQEKDGIVFRTALFEENSKRFSIVCVQPNDYSNIPAAIIATKVICKWDPRFVLLVGIAGGVSKNENLQLGDVVIPNLVHYVEVEKIKDGQKLGRPYSIASPAKEFKNSHQISREKKWTDRITLAKPEGSEKPKVVFGDIISGEKLEADYENKSLQQRLKEYDTMIAVEMESGGVSKAVDENSDTHINTKFFAVRGISDLCDLQNNQAARDTWKEYAAEAAAAYAYELLCNLTLYQNQSTRFLDETPDSLLTMPEILFNITYSDSSGNHELKEIPTLLEEKKKVVLIGRAGIGKSNAANAVAREFVKKNKVPIVIDLKDWKPGFFETLQKTSVELKEKMNALLRMSLGKLNEKILSELGNDVVFIVDGLNEIDSRGFGNETVREVISTVEEYVRNHVNGAPIMLTDRTHRGVIDDYSEIELNELSEDEVKRIVNENFETKFDAISTNARDILKVPYFLNYALDVKNPDLISETKALESFFTSRVKVDVDLISDVLFEYNKENSSLLFDAKDFEEKIGPESYQKLLNSRSIMINGKGEAKFEHQLKHEYLISRHLAKNEKNWGIIGLDVATLGASSIDSLFMTTEQLESKEASDKFLLQVFNWNWRAAIRCIARLENKGSGNYSEYTLIAMAALVAQKKFDSVHGTHLEAIASLDGIQNENCKKMAVAGNFDDIVGIVNGISNGEDWFANWRDIFIWDSAKTPSDDDIMKIKSEESIVGWTSSNALKRLALNEIHQGQLRIMYLALLDESPMNSTVRWRIAHTLGSFPSKVNADLLFKVIENDTYHWAKFGAARSLVEMAAKTEDSTLRKTIIDYFTQKHKEMHDAVREEIGKASMYHNAFGDWEESIRSLLEGIGQSLEEELTKREWEKIMKRFNDGKWKTR